MTCPTPAWPCVWGQSVMVMGVSLPFNFHLAHYEGPLDLLLDLIRKQEINIYAGRCITCRNRSARRIWR